MGEEGEGAGKDREGSRRVFGQTNQCRMEGFAYLFVGDDLDAIVHPARVEEEEGSELEGLEEK